jgi:hypothetical protein
VTCKLGAVAGWLSQEGVMARLEGLTRGAQVRGVRTDSLVEVVDVKGFGTSAIELTFKDVQGKPGNELLYRIGKLVRGRRWPTTGWCRAGRRS